MLVAMLIVSHIHFITLHLLFIDWVVIYIIITISHEAEQLHNFNEADDSSH